MLATHVPLSVAVIIALTLVRLQAGVVQIVEIGEVTSAPVVPCTSTASSAMRVPVEAAFFLPV